MDPAQKFIAPRLAPLGGSGARRAELILLSGAIALTVVAWMLMNAGHGEPHSSNVLTYGAGLAGLFLLAHVIIRRSAPDADPLLFPCAVVLNGLGLVLVHGLDLAERSDAAVAGLPAPMPDAPHQLVWTAIGVFLFVVVLLVVRDHRILARYGYTSGLAGLVLLLIPAVLPARFSEVNGGRVGYYFTDSPSNQENSPRYCF